MDSTRVVIPDPTMLAQGYILIGVTFNAILLGVMISQVWVYYMEYKKDNKSLKLYIAILFILDLFNTACGLGYLYKAMILEYNDTAYLNRITWLFDMDPAITGIIVAMVQLFFAWRIWALTKRYVFPVLIILTAITGGVAGIMVPVLISREPFFTALDKTEIYVIVIFWLACEVVGDILITAVLVVYLSKHKTGFDRSDRLVDRIIRMTIQTGLVTAIFALINLIVYLVNKTALHLLFNFALCKVYSNSLMSTLNARAAWVTEASFGSQRTDTENDAGVRSIVISNTYHGQTTPPLARNSKLLRPQSQHAPQPASDNTSPLSSISNTKHTEVPINDEPHELREVLLSDSLQGPIEI